MSLTAESARLSFGNLGGVVSLSNFTFADDVNGIGCLRIRCAVQRLQGKLGTLRASALEGYSLDRKKRCGANLLTLSADPFRYGRARTSLAVCKHEAIGLCVCYCKKVRRLTSRREFSRNCFLLLLRALAFFRKASAAFTRGKLTSSSIRNRLCPRRARNRRQKRQSVVSRKLPLLGFCLIARKRGAISINGRLFHGRFMGPEKNPHRFSTGDVITCAIYYAALVQSDNIAAHTLASQVGLALQSVVPTTASARLNPVAVFVGQMNALAKQLQMERTRFLNPHGIDEKEHPYSSAADMARLSRYATSNAGFRFTFRQRKANPVGEGSSLNTFEQHNELLA